jgi:riboflavin synthase
MFTGLIEDVGRVVSWQNEKSVLTLETHIPLAEIKIGESIAVNGVCLTVIQAVRSRLSFEVSPETVRRTALADLGQGDVVNLERSLKMGDRLGGHLVTGHVDGVGRLVRSAQEGISRIMAFTMPPELARQMVAKGSIAVDGISLTVNQCEASEFSVAVIPHTWDKTNLRAKRIDDRVNLETDLIGKYVEKLSMGKDAGLTRETLERFGYLTRGS